MSKLDKFKRKDKNSDNVWSSISDLMSGLMIVFLFTSVIFMSKVIDENTNIKKQQQTVENIVTTYEESKENIYEDLYNEFEGDMDNWHMEIDKDGTMEGYDLEIIKKVSNIVNIPVIASGGAGGYEDMFKAIDYGKASAVAAASIFHFTENTPKGAKMYLADRDIPTRI